MGWEQFVNIQFLNLCAKLSTINTTSKKSLSKYMPSHLKGKVIYQTDQRIEILFCSSGTIFILNLSYRE